MNSFGLLLAAASLFVTAGVARADEAAEAKAFVEAYVKDGKIVSEDFAWIAWRDSEDPQIRARWAALLEWRERQWGQNAARHDVEFRAAFGANYKPWSQAAYDCDLDIGCFIVGNGDFLLKSLGGYANARAALDEAHPIFKAFKLTVELTRDFSSNETPLAEEIERRLLTDQIMRLAHGTGLVSKLSLSDNGRKAFMVLLTRELLLADRETVLFLRNFVGRSGWPKKSEIGIAAARNLWLLAQHADFDPMLQWKILGLMKPLVALGEVEKSDFAYLYDRTYLKFTGKQRYATQFACFDGTYQLQPLDDPQQIEALRKEMELPPLAEYAEGFRGSCGQ